MTNTTDIFARVYRRISETVLDIDLADMRENGGKLMNLLLGSNSLKGIDPQGATCLLICTGCYLRRPQ